MKIIITVYLLYFSRLCNWNLGPFKIPRGYLDPANKKNNKTKEKRTTSKSKQNNASSFITASRALKKSLQPGLQESIFYILTPPLPGDYGRRAGEETNETVYA